MGTLNKCVKLQQFNCLAFQRVYTAQDACKTTVKSVTLKHLIKQERT